MYLSLYIYIYIYIYMHRDALRPDDGGEGLVVDGDLLL